MFKSKTFRWNVMGWSSIVFYAVCGLLLLLWPESALDIANYALAALTVLLGIALILMYVFSSPLDGVFSFNLTSGAVLVLVGIVLFCKSNILKMLLPALWGVSMIVGGFGKVQMAFDLQRMGTQKWWIMLIGALLSFVMGAFATFNPTFIATVATQFAGISMLVEAVLDTASLIVIKRRLRDAFPKADAKVE